MYERFDDSAIECVLAAQEQAQKLASQAVDTEHLLLGLAAIKGSIASQTLDSYGVTFEILESRVLPSSGGVAAESTSIELPLSERVQASIGLSWASAVQSGQNFIGPHNILIGLIDEGTGGAVDLLKSLGIDLGELRQQTIVRLKAFREREALARAKAAAAMNADPRQQFRETFLVEIRNILAYSLGLKDALLMIVNIIGKVMRTSRCRISVGTGSGARFFEFWSPDSGGSCKELGWPVPDSELLKMIYQASEPITLVSEQADLLDFEIAQEMQFLKVKSLLAIALQHKNRLQGYLMLHQCDDSRTWTSDEIEWLQRLSSIVAEHVSKQPN
jgi:GAF domain-containing protein